MLKACEFSRGLVTTNGFGAMLAILGLHRQVRQVLALSESLALQPWPPATATGVSENRVHADHPRAPLDTYCLGSSDSDGGYPALPGFQSTRSGQRLLRIQIAVIPLGQAGSAHPSTTATGSSRCSGHKT